MRSASCSQRCVGSRVGVATSEADTCTGAGVLPCPHFDGLPTRRPYPPAYPPMLRSWHSWVPGALRWRRRSCCGTPSSSWTSSSCWWCLGNSTAVSDGGRNRSTGFQAAG